jgi:hypothetical protein
MSRSVANHVFEHAANARTSHRTNTMNNSAKPADRTTFRSQFQLLAIGALIFSFQPIQAQDSSDAKPPTEAELRAKYQNCPEGYYSGPRPGKRWYTKDEYLWVVTPEFAAAYCMPPEFVDKELKGAEAIAYKLVQEGSENCGFGGNREACGRRTAHGFEIYYKSSLKIPSTSKTKYNYRAFYMLSSSKHLIGPNMLEKPVEQKEWESDRPGAQVKFSGWGLIGVKGSKPVWPIAAYREIQYVEELLPGYNYTSVEGSMGFFSNPRMENLGVNQFVLALDRPDEKRKDTERNLNSDYAHVIYLPQEFLNKIRIVDKQGEEAFRNLIRKAMPQTFAK